MKKIINTFKYGDKKVKKSLALAIFAGVITLGFGVAALLMSNMLCFFVAIVAAFITITLVQTFMIAEGENPTVVAPLGDIGTEESAPMEIDSAKTKKRKTKTEKTKTDNIKNEKTKTKYKHKVDNTGLDITEKREHNDEELTEEKSIVNKEPELKKEKNKKDKTKKKKTEVKEKKIIEADIESSDESTQGSQDEVDTEQLLGKSMEQQKDIYNEDDEYDEEKTKRKFKVITAETAASYTKKKIKKTLHKYKVVKDHRMVIVDRCDRLHIFQTPAYVWIQDNQFHILLIEEEPRLLMVPLFRITEINYLKKQPADEKNDYKLFEKSTILTESFRPYLPDYNHSNKTNDLTSYKNLYGINQGIYFTNNSAKNLFDLLGVEFLVEDKVTTSNKVNIYFKDAYKASIKLRDNVLDANGYADSITKILDDMAHSSVSYNEFKDTLNLMIKNKLITDEYANHYMDVRNSL
ncbi:MAG: hypothetical protein E7263_02060 [Lachnospiraceae bacterium]|nr:hypothetical protein [Lachnospiraceae bacterium]